MKKQSPLATMALTVTLTFLAVCAADIAAARAGDGGIQWYSYSEGQQRSQVEKKKQLLFFDAEWCRYCVQMEQETFRNSAIIAFVNRNFIPIRVNLDTEQKIAQQYQVRGVPNVWFLGENGDRIGNLPGYVAPDEMMDILRYIGSDSYLDMSFKDFLKD